MSKPKIYTLIPGGSAEIAPDSKLGPDVVKVNSASYLIEYKKESKKRGMVVDTSMGGNWPTIKKRIQDLIGGVENVTHILLTHTDLDHTQNLKEFSGAIMFYGGQAGLIDKNEYGAKKIYENGTIEIPEIRHQSFMRAHSKKDTVYFVDSANEGKVAFIGDLILAPLSAVPIRNQVTFDSAATVNPKVKFEAIKEIYQNQPDLEKFYLGHHDKALSHQEVGEYIKSLEESEEFQEFLKRF